MVGVCWVAYLSVVGCVLDRPCLLECSLQWSRQLATARLASLRREQASVSWPAGLEWPVDAHDKGRVCCGAHCRPGGLHCNGRPGCSRQAQSAPEGLEAVQRQQVHTQTGQAGVGLGGRRAHQQPLLLSLAPLPCALLTLLQLSVTRQALHRSSPCVEVLCHSLPLQAASVTPSGPCAKALTRSRPQDV